MTAPILIIAIGNESRGDDALAPLLSRKLPVHDLPEEYELLEDFQLQIEHAADLPGRKLVLFIDAGMDTPAPYSFYHVGANDSCTLYSHAITPEAVLSTYLQIYRQNPPPSFVLCIRGERFELGTTLSPEAIQYMESALTLMHKLLREPHASVWESHIV